jgi:hypothetical protein
MRRSAALLAVLVVAAAAAPAASTSAPVLLRFDKQFDPARTSVNGAPTWTGTVSGDGWTGALEAVLVDYRAGGVAEQICVRHAVAAGERSFVFVGCGTFNNVTNGIVLNGTVTSGWMGGAQVHDQAFRVDQSASRYEGTWRLSG